MQPWLSGIYTYAEFGSVLLAWLPILGGVYLIHRNDETPRIRGRWLRRFGRVTYRLCPLWTFSVEGKAPEDIAGRGYVVVANHESTADTFLLSWLPWDMCWVGKKELFDTPVIGWLLKLGGDIPVERGSKESARATMAKCAELLKKGLSIMMFPEGTRSADGSLGKFKDGAFRLAIDCGVPVVPVAVHGTKDCRPKGSLWFGRAKAVARILPAIPTSGLTHDDIPMLRERVRAAIARAKLELAIEARTVRDPEGAASLLGGPLPFSN